MTLKTATPLLACALATNACMVIDAQSQRAEGSFARTLTVSGPLDLDVQTPRGFTSTRIAFAAPANQPGDLRGATVELARRARGDAA